MKIFGFWGLWFFIFAPSIFATSSRGCHELLRRFSNGMEWPLDRRDTSIPLEGSTGQIFYGSSTAILYKPNFEIERGEGSIPFFLKLTYEPTDVVGFMRIPRLSLFFSFDETKPHRLHVDLNRDLSDALHDLNILSHGLHYIYDRSERSDEFHFSLSEPSIIRALNQIIHEELSLQDQGIRLPVIARDYSRIVKSHQPRSHIHSVLGGLTKSGFEELVEESGAEALLDQLLKKAESFPLIQAIGESGDWEIGLAIVSTDVELERPGDDLAGMMWEYVLVLKPTW